MPIVYPVESAPEFSVIIPVYASDPDAVDFLRNTLHQLNASSLQTFEIIVADDASPCGDAVRAVVQEAGAELVRLEEKRISGGQKCRGKERRRRHPDFYGC